MNNFFNLSDISALNFLHINCPSLKNYFGPVNSLLHFISSPLSAMFVTETWLTESLHDVFTIPGYRFFSRSRLNKLGGGVGIYVNNSFDCKVRQDLCQMTDYMECIFVECRQPRGPLILIGSVYRPPNTDIARFNNNLLSILNTIDLVTKNKNLTIFSEALT